MMEKRTNSILSNKIIEIKNLAEQLNVNDSIEKINIVCWQMEGLVKQTREYVKILNVNSEINIKELDE